VVRPRTRINGKIVPVVISEEKVASILETESLIQRPDGNGAGLLGAAVEVSKAPEGSRQDSL
jgi:hypothetical protein